MMDPMDGHSFLVKVSNVSTHPTMITREILLGHVSVFDESVIIAQLGTMDDGLTSDVRGSALLSKKQMDKNLSEFQT